MGVVKKRKHVSKKNKKDWRKHCDITDVEAFLEDQRLEERLGKFETKPDSDLFVVDTGGDEKPEAEDVKPLSRKLQKRAKLSETPKCFEVLLPKSKVEDPNKKRNHVNPVGLKKTALSKLSDKKRLEKGVYAKKLEIAKTNRKLSLEKKRKTKKLKENFDLDLWGGAVPESKGIPDTLIDDFIPVEAQIHNMLPKQRQISKPPTPKTLTTRKAIEAPHPGVSYNPTFQEHQELLQQVVDYERVMMKREAHINRVTTGMFQRVTQQQKENQWLEEMSTGLPTPHNPAEDSSDSASDNEYKAVNPPVKNKKKDHKARRKQKERLEEIERRKREKLDKKKITDIYKLRKIQSSITTREQKQQELRQKQQQKRIEKSVDAPPALNKNKIRKKEPDFVEPSQLTGDLRHISATSNLLKERYESLQHRGALAGAKLMMKKRRKVKAYFKPGHKVTDKEIEGYVNRAIKK